MGKSETATENPIFLHTCQKIKIFSFRQEIQFGYQRPEAVVTKIHFSEIRILYGTMSKEATTLLKKRRNALVLC